MQVQATLLYKAHKLEKGGYFISITELQTAAAPPSPLPQSSRGKSKRNEKKALQNRQAITPVFPQKTRNTGKSDKKIKVPRSISLTSILAADNPITLGENYRKEDIKPGSEAIPMGTLIFAREPGDRHSISCSPGNASFKITYSRSGAATWDINAPSINDAAVIVRVFMLAKIAISRLEMRDALSAVPQHQTNLDEHLKSKNNKKLMHLLHTLESSGHEEEHHKDSTERVWIEDKLAGWLEPLQEAMKQKRGPLYLAFGAAFMATIVWVWLPYYGYHSKWVGYLGWLLVSGYSIVGILFLLNALNLKSIEQRIKERIYEGTIEQLNAVLASLVQTNANVAAINLSPELPDEFPCELLLDQMDKNFHLKDRLVSIESVIKAREKHLASNIKHIEEHRDRVRRSIIAAGSGLAVGYFTSEVGELLMNYLHVTHQQDKNAMLYWLIANRDRIAPRLDVTPPKPPATIDAAPAHQGPVVTKQLKQAAAQGKASATHAASGKASTKASAPEHAPPPKEMAAAPAAGAVHETTHGTVEFNSAFMDNYHKPELYAQSWLLTITIVVSVLTAWIAMRKPAAEQGGGHAHH